MSLKSLAAKVGLAAVLAAGGTVFISSQGEDFIKQKEALVLTPYQDEAGVWTDGWGNTKGVVPGRTITREKAQKDFERYMQVFVKAVLDSLEPLDVLWQGQLDGYVSLTHNIGGGAFSKSTTATRHKDGDYPGAALAMLRYDKLRDQRTKQLRPSKGLAIRRYQEYNTVIASIPIEYWNTSRDRTRP